MWRPISTKDCKFSPAELAALTNIAGGIGGLGARLQDVTGEFLGAMTAAGYPVAANGSVPDQLRGHILSRAQWLFLTDFPALKSMLTKERKDLADEALKKLEAVAERKFGAIEPPTAPAGSTGNWNSEPRLVMRTHPVPSPAQQAGTAGSNYANPAAPGDT